MHRLSPVVLVAALVLCACDQPPTKEIAAAEAALASAEKDGAGEYAPERLAAARSALQEAERRVQAQDYRGGLSAANEAAEKARAATKSAEAAKQLVQSAAESARDETRIMLEELPALKDEAAQAHVPAEAFAALDGELAAIEALLVSADQALAKQDFLAARSQSEDARSKAQVLPDKYRQARSDWETAHPKKPKGKAKPTKKK
jgi:hypothetical protein